jgi:hypothetical protein
MGIDPNANKDNKKMQVDHHSPNVHGDANSHIQS